jgi:hypothetical protein
MIDTSCCVRYHLDKLEYLSYEGRSYLKLERGKMVFWGSSVPYFVIEWQPENGPGAYWLVNGAGESAVAAPSELTEYPINQKIDVE